MDIDAYCRWLSLFFFAAGHDPDDLFQEARLAAWLCPEHPRIAARRRVLDIINAAQRKPQFAELHDAPALEDVVDAVAAREKLRAILGAPRNDRERVAVGRTLRGEPIPYPEKSLQNALGAVRRRLALDSPAIGV